MSNSWSSRFGQWSGRFSPFGREASTGEAPEVRDNDYSYITQEDLKRGDYDDKSGPPRETDCLVLKNKKTTYSIHFPAYSIDRGELTIGVVRERAAKKIGASDPKRVKLIYRGKILKEEARACRAEGLREGSEIMCTVGDALPESQSDDDDEDSDGVGLESGTADGDKPKRKRNRNKNKKRKGKTAAEPSFAPPETLPVPPTATSRAPSPKLPSNATPTEKMNAIYAKLQELLPSCKDYIAHPPSDPAKKTFEHKRLSETVLAQVLLKLDAVETDEPDAKAQRKQLVKETQAVLDGLDNASR